MRKVFKLLISEMRGCKDDEGLTKKPARWDAMKHVAHMVEHSIKTKIKGKK